ncbi:MAG TPA: hypothetical protein VFR15_04650, partial [Chloroflexia bacterium]|nr:hypothetical protein [Chloroflexia bacterium]
IAGDAQSEGTPTFASFAPHLGQVGDRRGQVNGQFMAADGTVSRVEPAGDPALFVAREYDEVSRHNIPAVFAEWTRRSGPVYEKRLTADGPLMDSLFVLGRPVTEAYWVDAMIGGRTSRVLVQLFERRVLTYNPDNPPDWRVEMGNVGRAYFSWRYGEARPAPAVAGRASGSGVLVAGWNWPRGVPVAVRVEMAGAEAPVGGPVAAQPDESGYFSLVIPGSAELTGAVNSRANLRVVAAGAGGMVSLPFSPSPQIAPGSLEGMLSHVERDGANLLLTLAAADGEHKRMVLPPGARLRYAEGGAAPPEAVEPGAYAAAAGTEQNGVVQVARLDLLSVSGGGSVVGYTWLNGTKLRVSGRGWPGGQAVAFGTGTAAGEHERFASLTADSRGNLVGTVTLPGLNAAAPARTWLSASTVSSGGTARVLVPVVSLGTLTSRPLPGMLAYSARGGQVAAGPLQCPESGCAEGRALDLPSRPLTVSLGETLALRPRWGADPLISRAPFAFTGELYRLTGAASGTFVPSGPPVNSTGLLPGRPLSVALPNGMEQGIYVLIVRASWPGASGVLVHSFLLEVR